MNINFEENIKNVVIPIINYIIMLSVIFSLYIRYTTILAYCTDLRVMSLFHVYTVRGRGIEPGAQLVTELCRLLSIKLFKDVYKVNDV